MKEGGRRSSVRTSDESYFALEIKEIIAGELFVILGRHFGGLVEELSCRVELVMMVR